MKQELADEILRNIALSGSVETRVNPIIGGNLRAVLTTSSGAARIQSNVVKKFRLIIGQPGALSILNPFEIRCCLCRKVISYPCWYYDIRYAVNHFHYFVCFDSGDTSKPTCKCYRRSE